MVAAEIFIPKSGTPAMYKLGKINGEIAAVTIRYGILEFEFVYFLNGEFKKITEVRREELHIEEHEIIKIGFK